MILASCRRIAALHLLIKYNQYCTNQLLHYQLLGCLWQRYLHVNLAAKDYLAPLSALIQSTKQFKQRLGGDLEDIPAADIIDLRKGSHSVSNHHWIAVSKQVLQQAQNSGSRNEQHPLLTPLRSVLLCKS